MKTLIIRLIFLTAVLLALCPVLYAQEEPIEARHSMIFKFYEPIQPELIDDVLVIGITELDSLSVKYQLSDYDYFNIPDSNYIRNYLYIHLDNFTISEILTIFDEYYTYGIDYCYFIELEEPPSSTDGNSLIVCEMKVYPNPFNSETTISFTVAQSSMVKVEIFNIKGQLIKSLYSSFVETGSHSVIWNGTNENNDKVPSGVYLYQIKGDTFNFRKRMLLLK